MSTVARGVHECCPSCCLQIPTTGTTAAVDAAAARRYTHPPIHPPTHPKTCFLWALYTDDERVYCSRRQGSDTNEEDVYSLEMPEEGVKALKPTAGKVFEERYAKA